MNEKGTNFCSFSVVLSLFNICRFFELSAILLFCSSSNSVICFSSPMHIFFVLFIFSFKPHPKASLSYCFHVLVILLYFFFRIFPYILLIVLITARPEKFSQLSLLSLLINYWYPLSTCMGLPLHLHFSNSRFRYWRSLFVPYFGSSAIIYISFFSGLCWQLI